MFYEIQNMETSFVRLKEGLYVETAMQTVR